MKPTTRWARPWSVMLALAVVLAMIGAACAEEEEDLRDVNLALSTTSSFGYGYWLAVGLGYYEDEGLNVSLQGTGGSSDVAQILAANNAEAGMGVPGAMLPAIEAGAGLYPFFTYAYGEVFDVVVPAGSSISNIAGLAGMKRFRSYGRCWLKPGWTRTPTWRSSRWGPTLRASRRLWTMPGSMPIRPPSPTLPR